MHTSSARLDRLWTFFAPLFLGVLALDQWSKAWASHQVSSGTGSSIGFSLSHNDGIVFGLDLPIWAIYMLTVGVLAFAAFTVVQNRLWQNRSHLMALAFILAGAIGNLVDRIRFGYVVDFIQVYWWPTFNLADVFIVVGVVVLAWDAIFQGDSMGGAVNLILLEFLWIRG